MASQKEDHTQDMLQDPHPAGVTSWKTWQLSLGIKNLQKELAAEFAAMLATIQIVINLD